MTHLITLQTHPAHEPERSEPPAERRIAGSPQFSTWLLDESLGGRISSGIWAATPGETRMLRGDTYEFCHLLEGCVELTEDGQPPVRYHAGDSFIIKPGFVGTWKTLDAVRKIFVFCE